jgi:hypothetical protein
MGSMEMVPCPCVEEAVEGGSDEDKIKGRWKETRINQFTSY